MKSGTIITATGEKLHYFEVAPFTFRLTLNGKPFNVSEQIEAAFNKRAAENGY